MRSSLALADLRGTLSSLYYTKRYTRSPDSSPPSPLRIISLKSARRGYNATRLKDIGRPAPLSSIAYIIDVATRQALYYKVCGCGFRNSGLEVIYGR